MKKVDKRSDDEKLRDAVAKQQDDRRARGIDLATGRGGNIVIDAPGAQMVRADGRGMAPLVDVKGALPTETEGAYRCVARWAAGRLAKNGDRCENTIPFPGICPTCAEREEEGARRAAIAARIAREIPAEYHDVRWQNALDLRSEDGKRPRLAISEADFAAIRVALRALPPYGRAVICGAAGNGKSVIAAAWARGHLEEGVERVCFAQVRHLEDWRPVDPVAHPERDPITMAEYATLADRVVIDDLGDELHGALKDSGVAAMRLPAARTLIADRFEARRGFVVTTGHKKPKIEQLYADGTARRVFEGALVIDLDDVVQGAP